MIFKQSHLKCDSSSYLAKIYITYDVSRLGLFVGEKGSILALCRFLRNFLSGRAG